MRRLKAFGERIASRDPNRQAAEIHARIALLNRFPALGQAEITRVVRTQGDRGKLGLSSSCATEPVSFSDERATVHAGSPALASLAGFECLGHSGREWRCRPANEP